MRSRGWCAAIVLASGLVVLSSSRLGAQAVNATLLGTVTDSSGAVVPKAKVEIKEVNTGISRSAETNDSGNYVFADLQPGQYQVSAEKQNFKKAMHAAVDVVVNSTVRVDLKLEPGSVSETVEVVAETPLLQTDRVDIGRKIDVKQVEDLPLGTNRNFQGLIASVPGTTRPRLVHSAFFNSSESLSIEVNGQSRMANNLQFEGVDDNHRTGLLQVYIPPIEAIQTVDISTSNYDAELGRAGGAVTNVILKSGTNDFHGAAYEINRVSALAAKNFFQTIQKSPSTYNYYGANIGGPIWRNKTFFFGDFLRINDHQSQFQQATVPPLPFRNGDFSGTTTRVFDPVTVASGSPVQFNYTGAPIATCPAPPCLNVIDPARISPIARRILALVPLPNVAGKGLTDTNNYQATTKFIKNTTSFDVKMDHNASQNNRLSGRFSFSNQNLLQTPIYGLAGGPSNGAFSGTGHQRIWNTAVNYYHVFSPTLITELRAGVNHYRNVANNSDRGTNASDAIGIRGANLGDDNSSGLVAIRLSGGTTGGFADPLVGYSASLPWDRGETNINLVSNWTKNHSNHTFRWGVDIRRVRDALAQWQAQNPRGVFNFNNAVTGGTNSQVNAVASLLLDVPNSVGRDVPFNAKTWRDVEFFTYAQDKWQVTQKFTLDVGLRWEFYPPATPKGPGRFSNYDPTTNSLLLAGIGSNPLNLGRKKNYKDFAPRLGLAYRLTQKTVLRGGFAISYSPYPDNSYAFNFPLLQNNVFNAPSDFTQAQNAGQPVSMATGLPAPIIATIPSNGIIPLTGALLRQGYDVVPLNFREPYTESWNLAVQHALPGKFVLETAYVGNHGVRVPSVFNLNATQAAGVGQNGRPLFQTSGLTGDVNLRYIGTSSNYHSLQVKLERKFSGGLLLATAYTYSKVLGFKTDGAGVDNIHFYIGDFHRNYSPLEYDRRHNFLQTFIYELPFGKGKPLLTSGLGSKFLGGWQLNGFLGLRTGAPLVLSGGGTLNAPGNSQTPNVKGPFTILHGIGNDQFWFDINAFEKGSANVLGTAPRIAFSGPGSVNLDASLFRRFPIKERANLEFRAEAFSVTNTPQFANPGANIDTGNFGKVTSTNTAGAGNRQVQFGLKVAF